MARFPAQIPLPPPASLAAADAADWYRAGVQRIPDLLTEDREPDEHLKEAWEIKCMLRLAGALALSEPELAPSFLSGFPLPTLAEVMKGAGRFAARESRIALRQLLAISDQEQAVFARTVGGSLGLTVWDGKHTWVMTREGWQLQTNS